MGAVARVAGLCACVCGKAHLDNARSVNDATTCGNAEILKSLLTTNSYYEKRTIELAFEDWNDATEVMQQLVSMQNFSKVTSLLSILWKTTITLFFANFYGCMLVMQQQVLMQTILKSQLATKFYVSTVSSLLNLLCKVAMLSYHIHIMFNQIVLHTHNFEPCVTQHVCGVRIVNHINCL